MFCVNLSKNCKGKGLSFNLLVVSETDEDGHDIRPMWAIEPREDAPLKEITYGTVPNGWREVKPVIPLEVGKIYSVNGRYYFWFIKEGNKVRAEIEEVTDFIGKVHERQKKGKK